MFSQVGSVGNVKYHVMIIFARRDARLSGVIRGEIGFHVVILTVAMTRDKLHLSREGSLHPE
jgi:hypothetical protein